jgi:hypothetical protein
LPFFGVAQRKAERPDRSSCRQPDLDRLGPDSRYVLSSFTLASLMTTLPAGAQRRPSPMDESSRTNGLAAARGQSDTRGMARYRLQEAGHEYTAARTALGHYTDVTASRTPICDLGHSRVFRGVIERLLVMSRCLNSFARSAAEPVEKHAQRRLLFVVAGGSGRDGK